MRVPAVVLCGEAVISPAGVRVASLVERFGREAAIDHAGQSLEQLAAEVAAELRPEPAASGRERDRGQRR